MRKTSQAEKAYNVVREKLELGQIEPGKRLVENAWAQTIDVNRADIRQAFARLLGEGFLRKGQRGGFFTREITRRELIDAVEFRIVLEAAALRLAAHKALPEEVALLKQIASQMQSKAQAGQPASLFHADRQFHSAIVKIARNPGLEQAFRNLSLPLSWAIRKSQSLEKNALLAIAEDHLFLIETVFKQKQLNALADLLLGHIEKELVQPLRDDIAYFAH